MKNKKTDRTWLLNDFWFLNDCVLDGIYYIIKFSPGSSYILVSTHGKRGSALNGGYYASSSSNRNIFVLLSVQLASASIYILLLLLFLIWTERVARFPIYSCRQGHISAVISHSPFTLFVIGRFLCNSIKKKEMAGPPLSPWIAKKKEAKNKKTGILYSLGGLFLCSMYYILIWTNHDGVFSWLPSLVYRLYRSRPRWCALLLLSLTIYNVLGYYYELQLARRLVILYQIFKCGKFIFFPRLGDLLFTSISDRHFIFFIDPWVTQRDPDIYSRQYIHI